jgi:hypothetical protein
MLKWAGLNPSLYALHSPRAGAATEAFSLGIDPHVIDLKGRWKSKNSKFKYIRLSEKELVRKSKKSLPY